MSIHDFDWLQEWYKNQCDGDWEHEYGIKIDTVDNPGWYITINLIGTEQENVSFESVNIDNGSNDWVFCVVRNKNFEASCDPKSLTKVVSIFRNWTLKKTIKLNFNIFYELGFSIRKLIDSLCRG